MRYERIERALAIAALKLAAKPGSTLRRRQRIMDRELGYALIDIGAEAIIASEAQFAPMLAERQLQNAEAQRITADFASFYIDDPTSAGSLSEEIDALVAATEAEGPAFRGP